MKKKSQSLSKRMSGYILPVSGGMIGICTTLIGLVKILERQGSTARYADEFAAFVTLLFLASAAASYTAIRNGSNAELSARCELVADVCFLVGLVAVSAVAVFFAYEVI